MPVPARLSPSRLRREGRGRLSGLMFRSPRLKGRRRAESERSASGARGSPSAKAAAAPKALQVGREILGQRHRPLTTTDHRRDNDIASAPSTPPLSATRGGCAPRDGRENCLPKEPP